MKKKRKRRNNYEKSLFILGTILLTTIAVQTGIETYASNNSFNQEQIESKASKPKTQYSELEFDTHEEAKDNIQVIPEKVGSQLIWGIILLAIKKAELVLVLLLSISKIMVFLFVQIQF